MLLDYIKKQLALPAGYKMTYGDVGVKALSVFGPAYWDKKEAPEFDKDLFDRLKEFAESNGYEISSPKISSAKIPVKYGKEAQIFCMSLSINETYKEQ